jgi:hypothetical protein
MLPLPTQLSEAQQLVLTQLASGKTINEAAAAANVHRNTIANWRRSSEAFRNHWHTMQYEQAMHWRDEMQSLAPAAIETLQDLLTDPKTPPSVRLRAALAVLDKVSAPAPVQPDLHKSAQPAPKQNLNSLETLDRELVQEPGLAQPCTTAEPIEDERTPNGQDLEQLIAQVTPPLQFPSGMRDRRA